MAGMGSEEWRGNACLPPPHSNGPGSPRAMEMPAFRFPLDESTLTEAEEAAARFVVGPWPDTQSPVVLNGAGPGGPGFGLPGPGFVGHFPGAAGPGFVGGFPGAGFAPGPGMVLVPGEGDAMRAEMEANEAGGLPPRLFGNTAAASTPGAATGHWAPVQVVPADFSSWAAMVPGMLPAANGGPVPVVGHPGVLPPCGTFVPPVPTPGAGIPGVHGGPPPVVTSPAPSPNVRVVMPATGAPPVSGTAATPPAMPNRELWSSLSEEPSEFTNDTTPANGDWSRSGNNSGGVVSNAGSGAAAGTGGATGGGPRRARRAPTEQNQQRTAASTAAPLATTGRSDGEEDETTTSPQAEEPTADEEAPVKTAASTSPVAASQAPAQPPAQPSEQKPAAQPPAAPPVTPPSLPPKGASTGSPESRGSPKGNASAAASSTADAASLGLPPPPSVAAGGGTEGASTPATPATPAHPEFKKPDTWATLFAAKDAPDAGASPPPAKRKEDENRPKNTIIDYLLFLARQKGMMVDDDGSGPEAGEVPECLKKFSTTFDAGVSNTSRAKYVRRGMKNDANNCYMNVVIQSLLPCSALMQLLSHCAQRDDERPFYTCLVKLCKEFHSRRPVNEAFNVLAMAQVKEIISTWQSIGAQQDAGEFLFYMLNGMHEECKWKVALPDPSLASNAASGESNGGENGSQAGKADVRAAGVHEDSPIARIFGGMIRSSVRSNNGSKADSVSLEPFNHLILDISSPGVDSVWAALEAYCKTESVNEGHATKRLQFKVLPKVLILNLKRFAYNKETGIPTKIKKPIKYEEKLSFDHSWMDDDVEPLEYQLSAVICHHGESVNGGHYNAAVRYNSDWYIYDDVIVRQMSASEVVNQQFTAYLLMYQSSEKVILCP
eukprot:gnl/TRDRNA2_/TRDRNA2_91526_c0_seq1.p1 gnl/TRDRNA2_/TRDRNA2_91526_c0~~gnl/TRDRNA2_/TRDRNA2_91526_c0_seq1.p1  ORF type:complete len:889 (-),score=209.51 gnl/TRDRNA2_/TRDRNA2_91526_c0_seq1:54-2720(-)